MIPYGRQEVTQADVDAVVEVLRSDFLTQGPAVPNFEARVAAYCGASHAVAVNSATSALHLACLALGVGPGDRVWTSPVTFVASANCALHCGAQVDFVDIDPRSYNMCPAALARKLAMAERQGRLPKVVIPVHLCGHSCDMEAIHELAMRYGFRIIEDASHAIGGAYKESLIGSCRYSDIVVFSFHPVKIITTAEGGMALTNSAELAATIELLRTHGVTRDAHRMRPHEEGNWYYQQVALGLNYRMTELQAALGISQLARLAQYVARRNVLADRYDALLTGLPVVTPRREHDCHSAFHLYIVRLHEAVSRRAVFDSMRSAGVGVNVHYIPVHLQPYYADLGFRSGDFPEAERYYASAITLPLYPTMSEQQQDHVAAALHEALRT